MKPTKMVALLRGVNVGGKNKLPMADLAVLFAQAGCVDVSTFIQSGNVLFSADPEQACEVTTTIETEIEQQFGFRPPIILRTLDEIAEAVAHNPFWAAEVDEELLFVMFLRDTPDPESVSTLEPGRSAPDCFAVRGREIYLCLPHGAARTKLTNAYFDTKLNTISTSRNWRTVNALFDLLKKQ